MADKENWEYVLQQDDDGRKFEEILRGKFHFSRGILLALKRGERVWVNGRFTFLTARGKAGDVLTLLLSPPEESTIPGEIMPLDIIYEDDFILAVNKPPGQVVHPTHRYPGGTIGNGVVGYWERKGENRPFRPVHRIDRNTSGLVVIAKSQFAHQQLAWQLERGLIQKTYLGIVEGCPSPPEGEISAPIGLTPGSFMVRKIIPDGLPSLTRYKIVQPFKNTALVEFNPVTGRTHQIRVHCQHIGHPLLGDDFYGGSLELIGRHALHSLSYSLKHPLTGNMLTLEAPLPEDFHALLESLS